MLTRPKVCCREKINDQLRNSEENLTHRLCLCVFTRSTAAYEALKSFDIFNLHSVKSLQKILFLKIIMLLAFVMTSSHAFGNCMKVRNFLVKKKVSRFLKVLEFG
eukprot:Pompholyxophrys_sp_v1_NODE_188_length_1286_cov_1.308692.p4 type:complete len:105 gc:universal NODE_188_length_1286_cov_1.308692:60-374(+)